MQTLKRFIDISIAITLLVFFFPIILMTAIVVYLYMGRPIFFKQLRPGYKCAPFNIIKFRTMTNTIDSNNILLPADQRLNKIGKIIRKFSLDELPQLLNVLKGDIGLVGPRPLLMEYLPRYSKEQNRRHDVLPGITGWAQINGRNAISWEERFKLDVWYVDNWSLFLDIKILFLTFQKFFKSDDLNFEGNTIESPFMGTSEESNPMQK